jgi:hypothetical protein
MILEEVLRIERQIKDTDAAIKKHKQAVANNEASEVTDAGFIALEKRKKRLVETLAELKAKKPNQIP